MAKNKLSTPAWIIEGFDSPADYAKAKGIKKEKKKEKTFKVKLCPKCESYDVGLVLSNMDSEEETKTGKDWECHNCNWKGRDVDEKELTEDEFMKYLDDKGEEVA